MSMLIKILRCGDPLKWYSGIVGEVIPYTGTVPTRTGIEYRCRETAGYINFVSGEDAEIVYQINENNENNCVQH